jgi:two-component system OmpR family response regulator
VTPVRDGLEGLYLATTSPWDVIVMERHLPGVIDGIFIVRALRDLGKSTPTIMLSASKNLDEKVSGLHLGTDDYLCKPLALSELLARIGALIRQSSASDDAFSR